MMTEPDAELIVRLFCVLLTTGAKTVLLALIAPSTDSLWAGLVVPMPTLPELSTVTLAAPPVTKLKLSSEVFAMPVFVSSAKV